jgi:ribosomal protein S18 acetylase RimI-like enzyme
VDVVDVEELREDLIPELRDLIAEEFGERTAARLIDHADTEGVLLVGVDAHGVLGMIEGKIDVQWWSDNEEPGHVSPYAFITHIAVKARRRRQGCGRALLRAFADRAASAGCTWIETQMAWQKDRGRRSAFFASTGLNPVPNRTHQRIVGAAIADVR